MAAYKEDIVDIELTTGTIHRSFLAKSIGEGDKNADRFGIRAYRNGTPETLSGTCSGLFVRADGETVTIENGTINGNLAYVTLPEACYAVEGSFSLAIKAITADDTVTLRIVDGVVSRTSTDVIVDPGTILPSIEELIAAIEDAVESIPSDYSDLLETLTVKTISTIGEETQGKYISSLGIITTTAGTFAYAMPIPVKKGKTYTFIGTGTTNMAAICSCDDEGNNRKVICVYSESDTQETHTYIPDEDGYVGISYNYEEDHILNSIDEKTNQVTETKNNLIDWDALEIGKDWTGGTNPERAIIPVLLEANREYLVSVPENANIYSVSFVQTGASGMLESTMVYHGTRNTITTTKETIKGFIQFNAASGHTLTSSDFENYNVYIYEGDKTADITAIDTRARNVFGIKNNIIDLNDLQLGKDWTGETNDKRATVIVPIKPKSQYTIIVPASSNWPTISLVQKKDKWNTSLASETINSGTEHSFITDAEAYWLYVQFNGSVTLTSGMFSGYGIYLCKGLEKYENADSLVREAQMGWMNKKIVWLGTSIPAAGKYGFDNRHAYPDMVGDILRANVFNEAVGSSALHSKVPSLISANNPYGFMSNFEAVSRCLTNSAEEMEWIIEHFNDSNVFTQNVPETLSDDDKAFIRSCSWEEKLEKYFTAAAFPDVWVFDHGHNDNPNETTEATYTARTDVAGTQHDGYYIGGVYVNSSASSYMEYDVSGIEEVFLNGTIGGGYDVFDLFDGNGNLLSYHTNASEKAFNTFLIDTSSAAKLRISNPNNLISTVEVKKYTYGSMYNSLYSYQGCMDFLINKIKEYRPTARIIIIGEYENQKLPKVSYYQEEVAKRWEFPIYKQWEVLGLSQQVVKINGTYTTMLNAFIPDNLHPHSDTSGKTLKLIAENIAAWMNTIRP